MIATLSVLLACQLAGEIIVRLLPLPIPGPLIGMALLLLGLCLKGGVPAAMEDTVGKLLGHLSLLFVPAGVGILLHLDLIVASWWPILLALLASTALTIGITGVVMQRLAGR